MTTRTASPDTLPAGVPPLPSVPAVPSVPLEPALPDLLTVVCGDVGSVSESESESD